MVILEFILQWMINFLVNIMNLLNRRNLYEMNLLGQKEI